MVPYRPFFVPHAVLRAAAAEAAAKFPPIEPLPLLDLGDDAFQALCKCMHRPVGGWSDCGPDQSDER